MPEVFTSGKNLSRRIQHILNKNPIPSRRIIYQHMRHRSNELPILNDRAAAHALHDAACLLQQTRIRYAQQQIPSVFCRRLELFHLNGKCFDLAAADI